MILIQNSTLIKAGGVKKQEDILIEKGKILAIGKGLAAAGRSLPEPAEVIRGDGLLALPGLVDAHVHLRQPGFEEKETIRTGTLAAARGGFTTVMPMPNLRPAPDNPQTMAEYKALLEKEAVIRTEPYACITEGEKGRKVVEMGKMLLAGARAFSDDGVGVQSEEVMEQAMRQAASLGAVIAAHTEDNALKNGGYVHQGAFGEKRGWTGIPSSCEYAQIKRDLALVKKTGCAYHVCHVSAKESVALIRQAKKEGLPVTAEVTPHHLLLRDEDVKGPMEKMNPPLREEADRLALVEGLMDGTLDIIATDHAPHTQAEKNRTLSAAPFGIVGLETAFPLLYTKLVKVGVLSLERLVEAMSARPASIFGFTDRGRLKEGMAADLVLVDPEKERAVEKETFLSKGKNTPFQGWILSGFPVLTIARGQVVWEEHKRK